MRQVLMIFDVTTPVLWGKWLNLWSSTHMRTDRPLGDAAIHKDLYRVRAPVEAMGRGEQVDVAVGTDIGKGDVVRAIVRQHGLGECARAIVREHRDALLAALVLLA